MSQALKGIRVIDMTHNQAGPACAQILGFLGADVIKLEEPKGGDIARRNMRDRADSDSLFFLLFNANKRSLTLNLKTGRGKELFEGGSAGGNFLQAGSGAATLFGGGDGDQLYAAGDKRQALHAATLGFDHPRTGKRLTLHSKVPKDFEQLLRELRK